MKHSLPPLPPIISTPTDAVAQVSEIRTHQREHLVALYLSTRVRLLTKEIIAIGTLNTALVTPRDVFGPAFSVPCAGIILLHNHPSGLIEPSKEDIVFTENLVRAAELLGIHLIDHIIVSDDAFYSFREAGTLD